MRARFRLFNWKEALYGLTRLDWAGAGQSFRRSLQIYLDVGRRSMVPYVAIQAATCFLAAAEELAEAAAEPAAETTAEATADTPSGLRASAVVMMELAGRSMLLEKENWGRQDVWAFRQFGTCVSPLEFTHGARAVEFHWTELSTALMRLLHRYGASVGVTAQEGCGKQAAEAHAKGQRAQVEKKSAKVWALLDIAESMVISMRCVRWMAVRRRRRCCLHRRRPTTPLTLFCW